MMDRPRSDPGASSALGKLAGFVIAVVVLAIAAPYFKKQLPMLRRRMAARKEARLHAED